MDPDTNAPLTFEEHHELSGQLREANARLNELCTMVTGIYGPHNRASFTFLKLVSLIDHLMLDLQTQVQDDCPRHHTNGLYHS